MAALIGTWVYGDTGKTLQYTVKQPDGTAFDVSGANPITLTAQCRATGVTFSATGTVSDGPNGIFLFSTPIGAAPQPGELDAYEARITFTKAAKLYWTDNFRLAIVKFPV